MILHLWPGVRNRGAPGAGDADFATETPTRADSAATPVFGEQFVIPPAAGREAHVASVCETPSGGLAAAWYAGTREGHADVGIFVSRSDGPGAPWGPPQVVVTRRLAVEELDRHIRKVGNSIVFAGPDGTLHMVYVSIGIGGWTGSSLNVKTSPDEGRTWSRSRRLTLTPFFNVSQLVRGRPVGLSGGGVVVPIYHESFGKFPELLWLHLTSDGFPRWRRTRIAGGRSFYQPALAVTGPREALALLRASGHTRRRVGLSVTSDAGRSWSPVVRLDLANPDSALDALPLSGGRILLAFNDSALVRENLRLAVSSDGGTRWVRIATLEDAPGGDFGYPSLLQGSEGMIHCVYTWNRRAIKHAYFNQAWIDERLAEPTP